MNTVAIVPQLAMRLLQTQNVKRNNVATISLEKKIAEVNVPDSVPSALVSDSVPTAALVPDSVPTAAELVPEPVGSEAFGEAFTSTTL